MTDIEAIRRAVKLKDKLFFLGKERTGTKLSEQDCTDIIAALSALAPVAEGKAVIVPVEPTERQHEAGKEALDWFESCTERKQVHRYSLWDTIYRAMIGAGGVMK